MADAKYEVGFIGAGQMVTALASGFVEAGVVKADRVCASDRSQDSLDQLGDKLGGQFTAMSSNGEVARSASTVILGVKPHIVPAVVEEVRGELKRGQLVVSIAAGVSLDWLQEAMPGARVVRVMPNTPCLVGETAAGFCMGKHCTKEDAETVRRLLSAVGVCVEVPERNMDAVTGLSGSGPAYVFLFIEALADGGVRAGLPREQALELAAQTVMGSAKMVLETGKHPGELKDQVCSAGGATIEAVHALEMAGFRSSVMNAVEASATRSEEMSLPAVEKEPTA